MSTSFITPGHVRAFQAVTTQLYGEPTLTSCIINGEPGVAIVLMEHVGEGKVGVMPLFVAITPGMDIAFEGEFLRRRRRRGAEALDRAGVRDQRRHGDWTASCMTVTGRPRRLRLARFPSPFAFA